MKWLKSFLGVLFVASVMSFNVGCTDNTATPIESTGETPDQPAGHEQAAEEMNKKPDGV